ncbi:MAG: hypothetical protein Rubg2KO_23260 [Rubricoccaceae bacterium]
MRTLFLFALLLTAAGCASPDASPTSDAQDTPSEPTVELMNISSVFPEGLPFSEIARVGDMLFLTGMVGVTPGTLDIVEGGIEAESRQTMENIATMLEANGYSMSDVVKCTVMLEDISEWGTFNGVYETFFEAPYPARSAFGADGLAVGARVEVECFAAVPA